MKFNIFSFALCLFFGLLISVPAWSNDKEPERIKSITQVFYEEEYYVSQVDLWYLEIQKDNQDENAWMNYYLACRIVNLLDKNDNPHDLSSIYESVAKNIPNTYEYHYLSYLNGGSTDELFYHCDEAFRIDPNRTEILSHMIRYYAVNRDLDQMKFYNNKWLASGEISDGILSWNYNALMSVQANAILLTYGDNDTYPSWMLQQVHDIRPDVKIININLLKNQNYLDGIFRECGIPELSNNQLIKNGDFVPMVDHIFENSSRPVYVNVTIPKNIRDQYSEELYTVGLAFKYSKTPFDNIAVLKNNFENKFLTDHLKVGFQNDKSVSVLNSLNLNYLPAFVNLYVHYVQSEDNVNANRVSELIYNIGKAADKESEVAALMGESKKPKKLFETLMDIKHIDKTLKPVKPGLWSSSEEVSNELYDQFLMDLLRNKEFELLEICKTGKTDWMSLLPEGHKHITEEEIKFNGHPSDPGSPVQNISYEAAVEYCKWLSDSYNAYAKKKNFAEVEFRLPSEKEWMEAAKSGRGLAPYPWGGYYYQNAKGCFLGNFYSSHFPECEDCKYKSLGNDGSYFPVHTETYFPNDFGLYNMSGNVAEMVREKGIAKGGSWQDVPEECTIESVKKYNAPSPAVGFRVFMELKK